MDSSRCRFSRLSMLVQCEQSKKRANFCELWSGFRIGYGYLNMERVMFLFIFLFFLLGLSYSQTVNVRPGQCTSSLCNFGQCLQTNSSHFSCFCRRGYTASDCSVPVDECSLNLCKNNGSCFNRIQPAGFECVCMPAFTGIYCEKPYDVCEEQPCMNGGTCRPTSNGTFHCDCPTDFTGARCQTSAYECSTTENPCMGRGKCRNRNGSFECSCASPYTGDHCEQTLCSAQTMNPCQNGKCLLDEHNGDGFSCSCFPGFRGSLCEENIDDCVGVSCSGHGLCIDDIGKYRCLCLPGYSGANCNIAEPARADDEVVMDHCMSNPCDHGACLNRADGFSCFCENGWRGRTCSETDCSSTSCLNGGTCTIMVNGQGPVCLCDENWLGSRCEIAKDPCKNSPCQNAGLCVPLAATSAMKSECLCQPDYGGYYCEYRIDDCRGPTRCLNGGTCQDGIGNFSCACPPQFTGWRCDIPRVSATTIPTTASLRTTFPPTSLTPGTTTIAAPSSTRSSQRTVTTSAPVTSTRVPSSGSLIIVMPTNRPPNNQTVSTTPVITIPQAVVNTATVMLGFGQVNITSLRNSTLHSPSIQSPTPASMQSVLTALSRTTSTTFRTSSPPTTTGSSQNPFPSITIQTSQASEQSSTTSVFPVTVHAPSTQTQTTPVLSPPFDVENSDMPFEGVANAVNGTGMHDLPLQVAANPEVRCPENFCRNGGVCRLDQFHRFRCDCPLRFYGDICEDEVLITRPQFSGNGYLRYNLSSVAGSDYVAPPGNFEVALRVSIDGSTSPSNLTILEAGSEIFGPRIVQLMMVNRTTLSLSAVCGNSGLSLELQVSGSTVLATMDAPSTIFIAMQFPTSGSPNCSAILRSGSSIAQRGVSVQRSSSDNALADYVLVGGSPSSAANFTGSLLNLEINKKDVDFDTDVQSGFNIQQANLSTCSRVECRSNGSCLESATGWVCSCQMGHTGTLCELEECAMNPCVGGSTCVQRNANETRCICPLSRYGMFCEKVYTVTADLSYFGNVSGYTSFSTFPPIIQTRGHLELGFNFTILPDSNPANMDGSLLLMVGTPELISQDTEYILVGIKQNAVVAICNLGGGPLVLIPSTRLAPSISYRVTIALNKTSGILLTVNTSGQNGSSSRIVFPPSYYFRKFPFPAEVSVGGYGLIDALRLPGFHGFTGSITGLQFRTRSTGAFTPFSRPTGGRNVLPVPTDQQPACVSCITSASSCTNNQCSKDSTCAPDLSSGLAGYRCDCPWEKTGNFCDTRQIVATPSFNGLNSYLTFLPSSGLEDRLIIQFEVKPRTGSGWLLYAAEYPTQQTMSFLSVFLSTWTLYFRFNVGNDVTKSLSMALQSHNTDQWISVEVGKNATLAWITVDGRTTTADLSKVSLTHLRIFTNVYVGGVPSSIKTAFSSTVAGVSSFDGCISALTINSRPFPVLETLSGLNVGDCQGGSCESSRCRSFADRVRGSALNAQPEGPSFVSVGDPRYQQADKTLSLLSLSFRTNQSDGMLIWTGKVVNEHSDYLGVGLVGGFIEVVLNLGWQSKRAFLSPPSQRYDDDMWHQVVFSRQGSDLSLIVDGSSFLNSNISVPGSYKELDTDGLYHIGSFPSEHILDRETLGYFTRPFTGCISNVTFGADMPFQALSSLTGNPQPLIRCFS